MTRHSIELRTRKYVKSYGFLPLVRNLSDKYRRKFLDTATPRGLDVSKTAVEKVTHTKAKATGELIGNKIAVKL